MSIEHFNLQDYNYHKAHHTELLREAETARLVDQARQNRKQRNGIFHHVLGWIGQHLVAWGKQLQERYGNNNEVPYLDSSHFSW
jgi:hemerythrin